jgi:hypothetical protein
MDKSLPSSYLIIKADTTIFIINFMIIFNFQDGYNLTVLLATLVPSSTVQEEDVAWTFESLLRVGSFN